MKKLFYIALVILVGSCQFEDENAPKPTEGFIKYLGQLAEQEAKDIEPIYAADGITLEGFVIFGTQLLEDGTTDYYIIKTDVLGNLEVEVTLDFSGPVFGDINGSGDFNAPLEAVQGQETAGQIEVLEDGFLIIGTSSWTNNLIGANEYQFATYAFLDSDLNVIPEERYFIRADSSRDDFGFQNISRDLVANDVIALADGNFLMVGARETATETLFRFYYRKFDRANNTIWEKTSGFGSGDNVLVRAFENPDRSLSLFGYSNDPGEDGEDGVNTTYLRVNENGNFIDKDSNGVDEPAAQIVEFDEVLTDVIETVSGYVVVGTSTVLNDENYAFFMSLDFNGSATFRDTLSSDFTTDGTAATRLETRAFAVTETRNNRFVIVGEYPSFRVGSENRGAEAMFLRVDQIGRRTGFETNFGLGDGNDAAADAITLSDGKIVVATTADFGGGVKLISLIKLNETGQWSQ